MMSTCLHMMSTFQLKKNFFINIRHGRFRHSTRHKTTSDFKNSSHKTERSKKGCCRQSPPRKNRKAREEQRKMFEAQKKALDEANMKIAKYELKNVETPVSDPPSTESTKNVLTTTQWLSVISIVVSLAGIYYKREEIKGLLTKKPPITPPPPALNSPVVFVPKRGGIKPMD